VKKNIRAEVEGLARDVYKKLGSGYLEGVYERAMQVGLRLKRIRYESQKVVDLQYEGHCVGHGCPDLLVGSASDKLIVELKVVGKDKLGPAEKRQLLNYMELLKIPRGLLINFPKPGAKAEEPDFIDLPEPPGSVP
jgi:GxxExxY protein